MTNIIHDVAPRAQGDLARSAPARTRAPFARTRSPGTPICSCSRSAGDALRGAGDVTGKTIVDISNLVTPDYSGLALGFTTSAAEKIQKTVPTAKVVKAFNDYAAGRGTGIAPVWVPVA